MPRGIKLVCNVSYVSDNILTDRIFYCTSMEDFVDQMLADSDMRAKLEQIHIYSGKSEMTLREVAHCVIMAAINEGDD